mgnify:CR=1 FL=1
MTIRSIYQNLIQAEADYDAVGLLAGMSETAEYIALGVSLNALHTDLNDTRKALGITWPQFQALVSDEPVALAATTPGTGTANVGGAGGKDD